LSIQPGNGNDMSINQAVADDGSDEGDS